MSVKYQNAARTAETGHGVYRGHHVHEALQQMPFVERLISLI
jgi:hypothetical protein